LSSANETGIEGPSRNASTHKNSRKRQTPRPCRACNASAVCSATSARREKTLALSAFVRKHAHEPVPLVAGAPYKKSSRDSQWRVYVNAKVESDP